MRDTTEDLQDVSDILTFPEDRWTSFFGRPFVLANSQILGFQTETWFSTHPPLHRSLAPSLRVVLASPALRSLRWIPTRGFASRRSEQKTKDSEGQGESAQSEEESWMNFIVAGWTLVVEELANEWGSYLRLGLLPAACPAGGDRMNLHDRQFHFDRLW